MFSVRGEVREKDFCIVLAGKQQKCRDRDPRSIHRQHFRMPHRDGILDNPKRFIVQTLIFKGRLLGVAEVVLLGLFAPQT